MTDEDLKKCYGLFTDLWHLVKAYHNSHKNEEWEQLTNRCSDLVDKYGIRTRSLVLDTLELIERGF